MGGVRPIDGMRRGKSDRVKGIVVIGDTLSDGGGCGGKPEHGGAEFVTHGREDVVRGADSFF
jgi:hypothetical protein